MLQEIQGKKNKIIEIIHELNILAESGGVVDEKNVFDLLLNDFKEQLSFNVLCLGDFSSGKSTFVNKFFIGQELITTRHTTTTAKLCVVKYGDVLKLNIIDIHGNKKSYTDDLTAVLADFGAVGGEAIEQVNILELEVPSDILKEGVVVVDSPGLNDPEIERMKVTFDYIDNADCVLYFLNAQQAWKKNEKEFLEEKILTKKDLDKVFFILNYWDIIEDESERQNVLEYVNEQISQSLEIVKSSLMDSELSDLPLIPVSSKTGENFDFLQGELGKYFIDKKGNKLIEVKAKKISAFIRWIAERFEKSIHLIQKEHKDIDASLADLEREYQSHKASYEQFKEMVKGDYDELWKKYTSDIEGILKDVSGEVVRKLANRMHDIENEDDFKRLYLKNMKNILYKYKADLEHLELVLMESLQRKLQNYKAKLDLDNSLLDEYCAADNLKVTMDDVDFGHLNDNEFVYWTVGGALGSVATMAVLHATLTAASGGVLGLSAIPIFLVSSLYGKVRDEEKLAKALDEVMETLDEDIYDNLLSVYRPLFDYKKKKEMFEKVFSYIDSEIIDAFKDKETMYLNAKEIQVSPVEDEKIDKLQQGLKRLEEIDKSLQQLVSREN